MKRTVVFVFCIVALAAAIPVQDRILDETNEMAANNKACIEQTVVTSEHVEELQKNPKPETPEPGMCYIKCMIELSGVMPTRADIRRDCRKQTNVSWSALKKLKAGNFNQDDHKLKCYLRCFMTKNGIIGKNNEIDVEKALRHLPPGLQEPSRRVLGQCKNLPSKDPCDKAYQIVRCYFKFQPQILKSVSFV